MDPSTGVGAKVLTSGNEAAGGGAIRAGCRFYAGYPITPQNELTAYMATELPGCGGVFVQAESELAAINMVYGASAAGARAMTSSSSPGISLKQEGISYLAGSELPAVIINVQRGGPGLGNISPAQGDYYQATRGGGHGDYRTIALAPATVQEMCDLTYLAFDLADSYRTPVVVLSDGMVGQMMEAVSFDHLPEPSPPPKPWALTGTPGRERNTVVSFRLTPENLAELNRRLQGRYADICRNEVLYELAGPQDADVLLVAYGTAARICRQVVERPPQALPFKVALLRPITLWPFPQEALAELAQRVKGILVVELSAGQMVDDVRLAVEGRCRVEFFGRMGGQVPSASETVERLVGLFA
ncbi:MAG: 3-methyl-2-oxobutanoate dehydrogenase subunit VorB [Candidatus Brocadiae bacterium]|nr:3-methyl-2-oxobutanoate dehydrogenase subunit VorB [Candidatus Brocadiia bacterium]